MFKNNAEWLETHAMRAFPKDCHLLFKTNEKYLVKINSDNFEKKKGYI